MTNLHQCREQLHQRAITRRDFIQRTMALGLTLPAASALACDVLAATPASGGHLKAGIAGASTTDSWDPATYADTFMQMLGMGMCFNCLTEVAPSGELVPELAEAWEASNDAKTWTLKLREGVTFHNGKSFEATDVVASLKYHMGPDSKSQAKAIVDRIDSIKVDGKARVIITLKQGNADFPYILSDYHLIMMPNGEFKGGIGTGGYIAESFVPGVTAIARRNPDYFKSDRAHFDSVELIAMADPTSRMMALDAGDVDVINRVDLKTEDLLITRNKGIEIFEVTGNQHYTFPMITTSAPFDNNEIRLALKHAIDREDLVKNILLGHGRVANDHPIGPANRYFAEDLEQRTYDPDKARFHLKKAGVDTLKVKLSAADAAFQGAVDAALLYSESAKETGISIEVVREPNDGYWSNVWKKKPWCACYWSGRPTEDWMFTNTYASGAQGNDTFWANDRFDKILVEARVELDEDKRRAMYRDLQMIVRDEGGVVVPMYANYVDAASKKLAHGPMVGNALQMDSARLAERWWMV